MEADGPIGGERIAYAGEPPFSRGPPPVAFQQPRQSLGEVISSCVVTELRRKSVRIPMAQDGTAMGARLEE